MQANSLGRVVVSTSGKVVRATRDQRIMAHRVVFSVITGQRGKVWLGISELDRKSGAGVIREFWPADTRGGGSVDTFEVKSPDGANSIALEDYCIDAEIAGEGLHVAYWSTAPASYS